HPPKDLNPGPDGLRQTLPRDPRKIPGTNGTDTFAGGMARLLIDGFDQLGYPQTSPNFFTDHQFQYAGNGNWTRGSHNLRFGFDILRFALNQAVANPPGGFGGPAGGFMFRSRTPPLPGGPPANHHPRQPTTTASPRFCSASRGRPAATSSPSRGWKLAPMPTASIYETAGRLRRV